MLVSQIDVMGSVRSLLLLFLLSLVEVHCQQTFPYVSFMGQTLVNHSYVDLSTVGNSNNSVQCHTDLSTCCSGSQGPHRGDWYFPNGTRLQFSGDVYEARGAQRVVLHHTTATGPTGIYRCDIATVTVHDDTDISVRDTVYVGLYPSDDMQVVVSRTVSLLFCNDVGRDVTISGGEVTFDSGRPTLTCISTGGPATTVTWSRDSTTVTEGTETVLDDPVTAQYTHTLTVTTGGEYTCTVSNNKPSSDSAAIILGGTVIEVETLFQCYSRSSCLTSK